MNEKLYFKFFDKVFLFSPSVIEGLEIKKGVNYFNELNISLINELIKKLN